MTTLNKYSINLFVSLGSEIDSERYSQFSKNAQIQEMSKPTGFVYFQVKDLIEASLLCQKFIKFYNLGSSNWIGGRVIDNENNFIANVSYNGRIWESETFPCKEIII